MVPRADLMKFLITERDDRLVRTSRCMHAGMAALG